MCAADHQRDIANESLAEARAEASRYRRLFALVLDQYAGGRFTDTGEVFRGFDATGNVYETLGKRPKASEAPEIKGATDLGASFHDEPVGGFTGNWPPPGGMPSH